MATYTVVVNTGDGNNPWISGERRGSLQRFVNQLKRLEGGCQMPGTNTVGVKTVAVAAAASVTCAAVANADTITINGVALTAAQHNATGTAAFSTIVAGNIVTINGVAFTASAAPASETDFLVTGGDNAAAAALVVKINACTNGLISGVVTATASSATVTIRAVAQGTAGNSITLTKTGAPVTVSGATLANGAAATNNEFDYKGSNTETGDAIVACVAASSTSLISSHVVATNAAGVVTFTALVPGVSGNAITIATSNGARLAITGALSRLGSGSETSVSYTF